MKHAGFVSASFFSSPFLDPASLNNASTKVRLVGLRSVISKRRRSFLVKIICAKSDSLDDSTEQSLTNDQQNGNDDGESTKVEEIPEAIQVPYEFGYRQENIGFCKVLNAKISADHVTTTTNSTTTSSLAVTTATTTTIAASTAPPIDVDRPGTIIFPDDRISPVFVQTLRMSAPYIRAFTGSTFVIHVPGELMLQNSYESFIQDVALMNTLGMKLVLVLGCRTQVDICLKQNNITTEYYKGIRKTTPECLECLKQVTGTLIFNLESGMARGLQNALSRRKINVVTGNFYTAQPLGIIDDEDYMLTGKVRRFNIQGIKERLNRGDIVAMTSLGFSAVGDIYNCQSEEVASACAKELKADKLIYFAHAAIYNRMTNKIVENISLHTAKKLLPKIRQHVDESFLVAMSEAIEALDHGVNRAHILDRNMEGILLKEIFHRDGVGLMISADLYEGIRPGDASDLVSISELVRITRAPKYNFMIKTIESLMSNLVVVERDGAVIAFGALKFFSPETGSAQLFGLTIHPDYRNSGKDRILVNFLEREAFKRNVKKLYVTADQYSHFYDSNGFKEISHNEIPGGAESLISGGPPIKYMMKKLSGFTTDLEEEMLLRLKIK